MTTHHAFVEAATNGENFILAIAIAEKDKAKIEVLLERRPPFGPAKVSLKAGISWCDTRS